MKTALLSIASLSVLLMSACGSPSAPSGEDYKIRAATPGVVDHNVIPKKSKK